MSDAYPELTELRAALNGNAPATLEDVRETERLIDFEFPPDLVAFFGLCDGGEGWWGDTYLRIDSLEEIRFRSTDPDSQRYFSDLVVFGSDGGGESYVFLRGYRWLIVERDLIAGADSNITRGRSFLEFIRDLKKRPGVPPVDAAR